MHYLSRICVATSIVCGGFALSGCGRQGPPDDAGQPVAVTTLNVEPQPLPLLIEAVGRTEGSREIEIRARVDGIIERRVYSEGAQVKAGATLFQIDPVPYEIALAHARAALAQEQATLQQAKRNGDRLTALAQQNAVSKRQADDAVSAVEAAEAAVLAAQANVREAEINLSYTRVTAPIGGVAGRAVHSEGSLVTEGAESSLLTTVAQTDPIWVRFALSVQEYDGLRAAAGLLDAETLEVVLLGSDGKPYPVEGRINFTGSTVDTTLGTVQLRAEFANPQLAVLPGEYLRVRVAGGAAPAIAVPQSAVLQGSNGPYVWVVSGEGQAQRRDVQTGAWVGTDWRIRSGLNAGEAIIVDNLLKLKPGQPVTVQQTTRQARDDQDQARPAATAPANARKGAP